MLARCKEIPYSKPSNYVVSQALEGLGAASQQGSCNLNIFPSKPLKIWPLCKGISLVQKVIFLDNVNMRKYHVKIFDFRS